MEFATHIAPKKAAGGSKAAGKIATQISTLLANNGVPQHKHRSHVAKTLQISYPAARRLVLGEVPWSENDITTVLKSIGIDWDGLLVSTLKPQPTQPKTLSKIAINGIEHPCDVYAKPGRPPMASNGLCLCLDDHNNSAILLQKDASGWPTVQAIESIHIHPVYDHSGPRLAILDDDGDVVDSLKIRLAKYGFQTEGFTTAEEVVKRSHEKPVFDAYLLDWSLRGGKNISDYIEELRRASPHAAMVIMSGHFDSEDVDDGVSRLISHYHLAVIPKPSPSFTVGQAIKTAMDQMAQTQ